MAQLKDSLIAGDLRVTGTIYGAANLTSLNASGTGLGTSGQILTSTGTGLAWSSGVTPSSHTHGNITNDGKIGSTADLPVFTTTGGALSTVTVANARTKLGLGSLATKSTISDHTYVKATGTSRSQDVTLKNATAATVTSAGTWPTLGTAFSIPNVTAAGTASYSGGVLTITNTTLGTAFSVPNVTNIGTKPTFGTTTVAIDKQPTFTVTTENATLTHTIS